MLPTHERLVGDHGASLELDDWLIVDRELAVPDGHSQLGLDRQLVERRLPEVGSERLDPRAPELLGRVHCRIRVSDEGLRRHVSVGDREADADRRDDLVARERDGALHGARDRPSDGQRGGPGRDVLEDHHEFVPAKPRDGVSRANGALHPLADDGEERVPRLMAKRVVDKVEVVDVEEQDGDGGAAAIVTCERVGEAVEEEDAIREAGERVVHGAPLEQLLRAAERGDVLHLRDEPRGSARQVARNLRDRHPTPHGVAVGVDVALLHLVVRHLA